MFRALGDLGRRLLLGRQLELPLPPDGGGPPQGNKSHPPAHDPHHSIADRHHFIADPYTSSPHAEPPTDARACLSKLRALGLTGIRHCTLTSNRSTVVSFRVDQLRVHRALSDAPPHVLRAIVDFVNGRGAVRQRARRELLAFEIPRDPHAATRRRRREAPHPDDAPLVQRLLEAHRQLNQDRFDGALGDIAIRVSRRMRARLGHFSPGHQENPPEIAIGRRHLKRDGWASAAETLAHEMVHQWQHETQRPLAHDLSFRQKAREIGILPHARRVAGHAS